jgi:hypothetical protein
MLCVIFLVPFLRMRSRFECVYFDLILFDRIFGFYWRCQGYFFSFLVDAFCTLFDTIDSFIQRHADDGRTYLVKGVYVCGTCFFSLRDSTYLRILRVSVSGW